LRFNLSVLVEAGNIEWLLWVSSSLSLSYQPSGCFRPEAVVRQIKIAAMFSLA
jgi:hypothetical protein